MVIEVPFTLSDRQVRRLKRMWMRSNRRSVKAWRAIRRAVL